MEQRIMQGYNLARKKFGPVLKHGTAWNLEKLMHFNGKVKLLTS